MKKIVVGLLSIAGTHLLTAQGKIDKAIENLSKYYGQEKVYLLMDKDQYVVGDHIYFKSYVFNGYNRADDPSTLYVELYDHDKNLIDKRTIALSNGEGDGSFNLTTALKEDVYFIRAYTTWMTNFSDAFNYIKPIPIYNPESEQKLVQKKNSKWSAQAFPEGGTFVNNIPAKVAIRLTSAGTPPKSWTGFVFDPEKPNEKISTFSGLDQNVGIVTMTPKSGKNYKATITDDSGQKQTINFPAVSNSGIGLKIESNSDGIQYSVKGEGLANGLKAYTIVGTINNNLAYKANIKTTTNEASSKIPINPGDDINGVLQLSLFDNQDNLVAKRLCFIRPKNLSVTTPTFADTSLNNQARAFNSIDIQPEPDYKHYCVLVRDGNNLEPNANKENILSALWLTDDLGNDIYAPAQYFTKNANAEALDALMISEEWKRFNWSDVLAGKQPDIFNKPEKNLSFQGRITKNGITLPNTIVNLILKPKNGEQVITQETSDNKGIVRLNNIKFDEPLTISYYLNDKTADANQLDLHFFNTAPTSSYKENLPATNYQLQTGKTTPSQVVANAIQNLSNQKTIQDGEIQIQEVQLVAKKRDLTAELNKQLSSGRFSSFNARIFDLVNDNQDAQSSFNIFQWLQGRAAGLTFSMDNMGNYVPTIRGSQAKIFLDEVPTDASMINSLPVSNIAMVKILKNDGLEGNAIVIYTKRGNMGVESNDKTESKNKTMLRGYDKAIEFELPDITSDTYKKISKDTRELLYWNPKLSDEPNVAPRIKFFNNDNATNREIIIISFDKDDKILFYDEIK